MPQREERPPEGGRSAFPSKWNSGACPIHRLTSVIDLSPVDRTGGQGYV